MQDKLDAFNRFWRGEGPCLILIPCGETPAYDLDDYPRRFHNPEAMWESEFARAEPLIDWPTDGIPTVRPNLGVVFVPAAAGQGYSLREGQLPWPGEPLSRDAIRAARDADVEQAEVMRLAEAFYAIHAERGGGRVAAYQADTQGVFDIAHLLYGEELFLELADPAQAEWIDGLFDISAGLLTRVVRRLKRLLGEDAHSMIHGHGGPQGAYFPHAGVRMCEDTPTLLSPAMLQERVLPLIERAAEPFGGVFAHYCGKHDEFFDLLCRLDCVRAVDLGNPEMYDSRRLMESCAATGTVLHSGVASLPGEEWEAYVRRVAGLVRETGARVILRAAVAPAGRDACQAMLDLWHELTAPA